jgi:hypothetical protein
MALIHSGKLTLNPPFIGWISLNIDYASDMKKFSDLLSNIFETHQGRIYTNYVFSMEYFEEGIVFSYVPITHDEAMNYYIKELESFNWIENDEK